MKIQVNRGRLILFISVALLILCAVVLTHRSPSPIVFVNCTQARQAGHVNIPSTSPYYSVHLDRNRNGVACQE